VPPPILEVSTKIHIKVPKKLIILWRTDDELFCKEILAIFKNFSHWCNILINVILNFSPHHCFGSGSTFVFRNRGKQKIYPVGWRIALPRDLTQ
jgi:hypothetical protein